MCGIINTGRNAVSTIGLALAFFREYGESIKKVVTAAGADLQEFHETDHLSDHLWWCRMFNFARRFFCSYFVDGENFCEESLQRIVSINDIFWQFFCPAQSWLSLHRGRN